MAMSTSSFHQRWFYPVWLAHSAFTVGGVVLGFWGIVIFCMFGAPDWLGFLHFLVWLLLTLSPLLGLIAAFASRWRRFYLPFAIATPIYFLTVMASAHSGLTSCEGP
jgi:hypothetical protein